MECFFTRPKHHCEKTVDGGRLGKYPDFLVHWTLIFINVLTALVSVFCITSSISPQSKEDVTRLCITLTSTVLCAVYLKS